MSSVTVPLTKNNPEVRDRRQLRATVYQVLEKQRIRPVGRFRFSKWGSTMSLLVLGGYFEPLPPRFVTLLGVPGRRGGLQLRRDDGRLRKQRAVSLLLLLLRSGGGRRRSGGRHGYDGAAGAWSRARATTTGRTLL